VYQPACPDGWNPKRPCYGRVWIDQPGNPERVRHTVSLGICRTKTVARQRLQEWIEREGINTKEYFQQNTAPTVTFREQAEAWLASLPNRRRRPVKPATIYGWRTSLNKWLYPIVGHLPLAEVGNAALKAVVDKMSAANLAPQTIVTHTRPLKMVVASAINSEGEHLFVRRWNHDFAGMPIIDPTKQPRYRLLAVLLAALGLRVGEVLGLQTDDFSSDCRVLHIRRSVWHRKLQQPKTPNAIRVIDVPEQLAQVLREYVAGKSGLLFCTRKGGPLSYRNVVRAWYASGASCGHALRRFRTEQLRRQRVPEDLIRLWLGHAAQSVTDRYAQGLSEDEAWRQRWAETVGVGFALIGLHGVTNVVSIESVRVA